MKHRLPIAFLAIVFCAAAHSQSGDFSAASRRDFSEIKVAQSEENIAVLTGKVVSEEGFALPGSVTVVLRCDNDERARSHSDAQGSFSLTLAVGGGAPGGGFLPNAAGAISSFRLADCELYGELSGYRSERIRLSAGTDSGIVQVGVITLHPISRETASSISVTSLAAPGKAKKALEKGREQARKGKWASAAACFKRAVEVYPRFALAWVELGRTQVRQNSFAEAQESFQRSVEQDSRFVDGYAGLAYVALQQDQWKELADTSERVVEFAPDSAQFWFLNALASFNLGNTKQAEVSIGRGFRLDPQHQIPDMEYLYGLILARRQDYGAAVEHVSAYLRLAPHGGNVEQARAALAQLQRQAQLPTSASR